jgi:hypothetical protein
MYCQSCGSEIPAGAAICPKCNLNIAPPPPPPPAYGPPAYYPPMYPPPFMFGKSVAAGIFIMLASMICFLFAIFVFFDVILYYLEYPDDYYYDSDIYYYIFVFILSIFAFCFGLITSILCFKRVRYKIALVGSLILLITPFFMFVDYIFIFGMFTLISAVPGFAFMVIAKRDFDIQAGVIPPYYLPPTVPPPMPPPMPAPAPVQAPPQPSVADKMIDLRKMKDAGLISPEEYEAKRQELLKAL